jgi:hypothetical protein
MESARATVARIRPISWKVCVVGEDSANYVRNVLGESGMDCTDAVREPELQEPPMFSFIATPRAEAPLTAPELQAILDQDDRIVSAFEA